MLIIAGHKQARKLAGMAADFCPICREFRAFEVSVVRKVPHLYYIPMGGGTVLVHELECTACRSIIGVHDPGLAGFSKTYVRDLAELARLTNPDVVARNRPRLEQLERLSRGEISQRERRDMIREPFEALDYMIHRRWGNRSIPTLGGLGVAAAAVLIGVSAALWTSGNGHRTAAPLLVLIAVLPLVLGVVGLTHGPRRWTRRHIYPRLAAALIPLSPSRAELSRAIEDLRKARRGIARRVRAEELAAELDRVTGARGKRAPG